MGIATEDLFSKQRLTSPCIGAIDQAHLLQQVEQLDMVRARYRKIMRSPRMGGWDQ